jgi:hypothetical protein
MLRQMNVSEEDAQAWGRMLKQAVDEAKQELEQFPAAPIEAY